MVVNGGSDDGGDSTGDVDGDGGGDRGDSGDVGKALRYNPIFVYCLPV